MAVDEAILDGVIRGESAPTLRLYAWDPPCLSLGHAQPFADVDTARIAQFGWDVVRRPTGGRAILHTDELTYSVIAPKSDHVVQGDLLTSYRRIAGSLVNAARQLGIPASMEAGRRSAASNNPVCFEEPSSYEITADGRKLIGSAQARRKDAVLQHGSLPLRGDLTRITRALVFESEDARVAAARQLLSRATTAEHVLGSAPAWEQAATALANSFGSDMGVELVGGKLTDAETSAASQLLAGKYASEAWTRLR